MHVLLSLVEHGLLRQDRADLHLGFPHALHVQFDDLRRSPVVTVGGDDSHVLHLLYGVRVPPEAGGVPCKALRRCLHLGEELLRRLPLDAQCLPSK